MVLRTTINAFVTMICFCISVCSYGYATKFDKKRLEFDGGFSFPMIESSQLEELELWMWNIGGHYKFAPKFYKNLDATLGLSYQGSRVHWSLGSFDRAGWGYEFLVEIGFAHHFSNKFLYYGVLKVPFYSKLEMGGIAKSSNGQEQFDISTVTNYGGTGVELAFGLEYILNYFVFSKKDIYPSFGVELGYYMRNYAYKSRESDPEVYTDVDKAGEDIKMSGISAQIILKFRL